MQKYEKEIKDWIGFIVKNATKLSNKISSVDDLTQDGILSLIEALNSRPENININAYLRNKIFQGIYNRAIGTSFAVSFPSGSMAILEENDGMSKKLKGYHIEDDDDLVSLVDHKQDFNNLDISIDIKSILDKYDKNKFAHLYFLGGLNYREISEKTGMSISSVSKIVNRVKEIIFNKLRCHVS